MATGQTILNLMEALSPELQLQTGESNVTQALLILNACQDILETLLAQHPQVYGGSVGTITTTGGQEYTTFPSGVLRIDGLDFLDPATLLPMYPLTVRRSRGGHRFARPYWYAYLGTSVTQGRPSTYWTNGTRIYWDPLPDQSYSIRWMGFKTADDITALGSFVYPDSAMLPLAALAARVLRSGLDDPSQDIGTIAKDSLNSYIETVSGFQRDGAHGLVYESGHDT